MSLFWNTNYVIGVCFRIALGVLPFFFLIGCGGSRSIILSNPIQLSTVTITPGASSIALGQTQQLKATGNYNDGSSKDLTGSVTWNSSNGGIASVNGSGLVVSHTLGNVTFTATSGTATGSGTLTVAQAAVISVEVAPSSLSLALGSTTSLTATGIFTNGTKQDLTKSVTWKSANPVIVEVGAGGKVLAKGVGDALLTAATESTTASCQVVVTSAALVSIEVSEASSKIPLGVTSQLTARGTFTDGSSEDLTKTVSWSSSPAGVVAISSSGVATGRTVGSATIKAVSGSIAGTGSLSVSAAQLTSITVAAGDAVMPLGTTQNLVARGVYSDGSESDLTSSVAWASDSTSTVGVGAGGDAVAKRMGIARVSASSSGLSGGVVLTVSAPALTGITINPVSPATPIGSSLQLSAKGTFTDGTTQDVTGNVTWTVDDPTITSVSMAGSAMAQKVGSTGVEASYSGVAGLATLVVQPVALVNYFSAVAGGVDTTVRVAATGGYGNNLCAAVYVFDKDQQMAECCGCRISENGLRTFSLSKDLTANPLTGVLSNTGSVMMVTADYESNSTCDASAVTPEGLGTAWATHLQSGAQTGTTQNGTVVSETPFSRTPLNPALLSALQAQCMFIEQLGSGQGVCKCGSGD